MDRRTLLSGSLVLALGARQARTSTSDMQRRLPMAAPHTHLTLGIRFITQRDGKPFERGRETASYEFNDDGSITFRASSISEEPKVSRDVIYTLGPAYQPLEAFVRLQVEGHHEGSGWFRFHEGEVEAETANRTAGRKSERIPVASPVRAFVAHPVSTDAMLFAALDTTIGRARQRLLGVATSSADAFGRVGPTFKPATVFAEYHGRESIRTDVGVFETERFALYTQEEQREPFETLWTLPDTCIFVRAEAGAPYNTRYELVSFEPR
jgi:hypothetical protein